MLAGGDATSYGRQAKYIILMISDGAGFNTFEAASYYRHGRLGGQIYDSPEFVAYGCTNYMVTGGYDPESFWNDPLYSRSNATDSAAAATAIHTGVKTYDEAINVDSSGNPLTTIAQIADQQGKSTGAVTSVELSHATPACVWAHNVSRDHYSAIANEMIFQSGLDVILGTGNPEFDNNGMPYMQTNRNYVGGETTWNALKFGTTGQNWALIQSKSDFEAIAQRSVALPARLIGIPQVFETLQVKRSGTAMDPVCPFNANVPSLTTMTQAALNVLAQDSDGFFLMVEGGAVDWASHYRNLGRMIEEQVEFNLAVEAVVQWIEQNSSWEETLLIITADHETGMLWGANTFSGSTFNGWQHIGNNGQGVLPSGQYVSSNHTNSLVPLFARGAGSERFTGLVDGTDIQAGTFWNFSGQYIDNTDLFTVMNQAFAEPVFFEDFNLQSAVEAALGISDPNPADMLALYSLSADSLGIASLTGLEYALNLQTLDLGWNQIDDLSPLAGLIHLQDVYLSHNQITDITPLTGLDLLNWLFLSYNQIHNVEALSGMNQLLSLYLMHNPLDTLSYCRWIPVIEAMNPELSLYLDPNPNELTADCSTDLVELTVWQVQWLSDSCMPDNEWCGHADLDHNGEVNLFDFSVFARLWLMDPL